MSSLRYKGNHVYLQTKMNGKWKDLPLHITVENIEYKRTKNGKRKPVFPKEAYEIKKKVDYETTLIEMGYKKAEEMNRPQAPTLSLVKDEYILIRGTANLTKLSKEHYERSAKYFIQNCGDLPVTEYQDIEIAKFRDWLLSHYAQPTAATTLRRLCTLFNYAVKKHYLTENKVSQFLMKEDEKEPVFFTREELQAFAQYTAVHDPDLMYQCWFILYSGLRVSDSCNLTWDRLNYKERQIRYWNQKGKRWASAPIYPTLHNEVLRVITHAYEPYVFKYRSRWVVRDHFEKVKKAIGLKDELTIHCFKKKVGENLYEAGIDEITIASIMQHHDISTTKKHYIKIQNERSIEAMERASSSIRGILPLPVHLNVCFNDDENASLGHS